jgi:hypothetical protein
MARRFLGRCNPVAFYYQSWHAAAIRIALRTDGEPRVDGLTDALTGDHHLEQAGLVTLFK